MLNATIVSPTNKKMSVRVLERFDIIFVLDMHYRYYIFTTNNQYFKTGN